MNPADVLRVSCVVLRRGEKILLVQRPAHKAEGLKWEFPGGKIEAGETAEACIHREIREELGIRLEVRGRLAPVTHPLDQKQLVMHAFLAIEAGGELSLHEHVDQKWLRLDELEAMDLCAADMPVVRLLSGSDLESLAWWR